MLSRSIRQAAVKGARMASTKRSSVNGPGAFETAYQVFMKKNVTYVGTILVAAIVVEGVFGSVTNAIWESSNRGVSLSVQPFARLCCLHRSARSLTNAMLPFWWSMCASLYVCSACTTTSTGANSRATTMRRRRRTRTTSKRARPIRASERALRQADGLICSADVKELHLSVGQSSERKHGLKQ